MTDTVHCYTCASHRYHDEPMPGCHRCGSTPHERRSQRWTRICQTCWQDRHPDDYCPDLTDMAECAVCGDYALTLSVHPEETR
jgi:NMD protein affecting ribosome stability and mRNA decay